MGQIYLYNKIFVSKNYQHPKIVGILRHIAVSSTLNRIYTLIYVVIPIVIYSCNLVQSSRNSCKMGDFDTFIGQYQNVVNGYKVENG